MFFQHQNEVSGLFESYWVKRGLVFELGIVEVEMASNVPMN